MLESYSSIINYLNEYISDEILSLNKDSEVSKALLTLKNKLIKDSNLIKMNEIYQNNNLFSKLTPGQIERLAILVEESGESLQAIGKVLRHGYDAYDTITSTQYDNRKDLEIELGQVKHAINMLADKDLDQRHINIAEIHRFDKLKHYLHHQD